LISSGVAGCGQTQPNPAVLEKKIVFFFCTLAETFSRRGAGYMVRVNRLYDKTLYLFCDMFGRFH